MKPVKNMPTNPELWSRAKAAAKSKYDVYPCVPMDSQALTKDGWKHYTELSIGEDILAYNQETNKNEWTPIISLQKFEDAPIIRLYKKQTNFDIKCTPNHKWVLAESNLKYPDNFVEAKDITKHMKIKISAELSDNGNGLNLNTFFKKDSWVKNILKMSIPQIQSYFASGIVYDGHDKGLTKKEDKQTYGFSQKEKDHGLAMEIAAVFLGYRVCSVIKKDNPTITGWTFIRRNTESTQNLHKEDAGISDVWCPTTKFGTWVMKQNSYVTITGNSAYANGFAAKWYKERGGDWKKMQVMGNGGTKVTLMKTVQKKSKPNLERQVNRWLDNPMAKAENDSEYGKWFNPKTKKWEQEDPIDNVRHTSAGRYTAEAIANKTGNIPFISNTLGYLGSNLLGAAHEAGTYFNDPRNFKIKTREALEDLYNNNMGAIIGVTPFITPSQKTKIIKNLSDNNLIPDGMGEMDPFHKGVKSNYQQGGQKMPAELAYARFAAAGNLDQLSKYGYKNGGLTIPMYANGGGIPERYKNMGFTSVGTKKDSTRPGKKWMVLAKKGEDYKVVHGGYQGMQDFKQHHSEQRRENFWNRMGGKNSAKATDPFSPLYWHKKFGTWQNGGELRQFQPGGTNGGVQDHYVNTEPLVNKLKWGTPNPMLDTFQQQGQQIANQVGEIPYMEMDSNQNTKEAVTPESIQDVKKPNIKTKTVREPFNQKYMMASNLLFTGLDMLGKRNKNSYSNAMNDFNKNQSEYENNNVDLYSTSQDYYGKYEEGGTKNSLKTFYETMAQDPTYFADELEALKDDYYQEVAEQQLQKEEENYQTLSEYVNAVVSNNMPTGKSGQYDMDMTYQPYQAPQRRQIFSGSSDDRMPYLPNYAPQLNVGFNAKPSDNAQFAYNYFQQSGLAPHQAAGLVGNFIQESNLNPNITNQIGAFGAGQWLGPRKEALLAYAKSKGKPANDLKTQLDFTLHELNTTEKKAGLALLKTKTPEQAALVVRKKYERPGEGEANDKRRIKVAQNLYYGKN